MSQITDFPARLAALKADILANSDLNTKPNNGDGDYEIAALYNLPKSPDYWVWNSRVSTDVIMDAINWAALTPVDVPDTTQLWSNRLQLCLAKTSLLGLALKRDYVDASKVNIRSGLQDVLSAVPSGVGGANNSAGWTAVKTAMARKATRGEALFATGTGSAANPATAVIEGFIQPSDVTAARVFA
jgi:hypothetical protein